MTQEIVKYIESTQRRQLLQLCTEFAELCNHEGIPVRAFDHPSLLYLSEISDARAEEIYKSFGKVHRLYEIAKVKKLNLRDTKQLTWWAVKELGMRPPSDFFDKIEDSDIVECYDSNQVQIFRSMSFFEFCTYDVLSVLTRPWHELYGRDLTLNTQALREMVEVLLAGDATMEFTLPAHRLWEVSSLEKREFTMLHRYRGPLFANGSKKPGGVIMTSHAEILTK